MNLSDKLLEPWYLWISNQCLSLAKHFPNSLKKKWIYAKEKGPGKYQRLGFYGMKT